LVALDQDCQVAENDLSFSIWITFLWRKALVKRKLLMKAMQLIFGILSAITLIFPTLGGNTASIPQTAILNWEYDVPTSYYQYSGLTLDNFIEKVANGDAGLLRGVYVNDVLALRVVQQPVNQSGFVSTLIGVVTQFMDANKYGNIGLLSHNFLSGKLFFNLKKGDMIQLIYGDGSVEKFQVDEILQFQALQPENPHSTFVDLDSGRRISASSLFLNVYSGKRHLTLQTCIQKENELSWGRYFIIAKPITQ
jgi:hypothetical protein